MPGKACRGVQTCTDSVSKSQRLHVVRRLSLQGTVAFEVGLMRMRTRERTRTHPPPESKKTGPWPCRPAWTHRSTDTPAQNLTEDVGGRNRSELGWNGFQGLWEMFGGLNEPFMHFLGSDEGSQGHWATKGALLPSHLAIFSSNADSVKALMLQTASGFVGRYSHSCNLFSLDLPAFSKIPLSPQRLQACEGRRAALVDAHEVADEARVEVPWAAQKTAKKRRRGGFFRGVPGGFSSPETLEVDLELGAFTARGSEKSNLHELVRKLEKTPCSRGGRGGGSERLFNLEAT